MMAAVPASASGTVMQAMKVGQKRRKKTKMTITTSEMLSKSENCTSSTEARIVVVRSLSWKILIEGGIHFVSCGSAARIRSTVSITFAPGCLKTISSTAGWVPAQPATRSFSTPSIALPSELIRIGMFCFWVITRDWYFSGSKSWSLLASV